MCRLPGRVLREVVSRVYDFVSVTPRKLTNQLKMATIIKRQPHTASKQDDVVSDGEGETKNVKISPEEKAKADAASRTSGCRMIARRPISGMSP